MGGLGAHVHFICAQLARLATASGLTTMFGGGTGPAAGSNATTCTAGPNHISYAVFTLNNCALSHQAHIVEKPTNFSNGPRRAESYLQGECG